MANLALSKQKAQEADAQQGTGGLLTSKVEAAAKSLMTSKVNPNQVFEVHGVIDRSGSMDHEYRRGTVQEVVNRLLGFAVIVDDDGNVPLYFFDNHVEEHTVELGNFHNFVGKQRISARGSTDLTSALAAVCRATGNDDLLSGSGGRGFLRRGGSAPSVKQSKTPAYVVIVTDGQPDDEESATDLIRKMSYRGIFLKFLYLGNNHRGWEYLESLDDDIPVGVAYEKGGRLIDNVDAKNVGEISRMADEDFYAAMFDEVMSWLAAARQNGLIV